MLCGRPLARLLILAPLLACADHGLRYAPGDVVARFIESDAEVVLDVATLYDLEPVFEIDLRDNGSRVALEGRNLKIGDRTRGGIRVVPQARDPQVIAELDVDPNAVHVIEVELRQFRRESLKLYWRAGDQLFSEERSLAVDAGSRGHGPPGVFRFELVDLPKWRGDVSFLRFDPPGDAEETFKVRSIRGLRRALAEDRLAGAVARPWKIELQHDSRNALLAPPGVSHELSLRIPPRASLRIAYGVPPSLRAPVRFKVVGGGSRKPPVTLFADEVDPGQASRVGRWIDRVVELNELSGLDLTLELITETEDPLGEPSGFPAWANPEVIAPKTPDDRPNVIIICLDTLRADRLSGYGHELATSPNIDRWAGDSGVVFRNTVAGAPWTLPSHASIFTGLDAVRHGVNFSYPAPPELDMMAEHFRRDGYLTAAITGGGYLHPRYGYAQGFDTFQFWPLPEAEAELGWVTETTLRWLDAHRDRRFFLFVHTYEVHYPHRRRQPFFNRLAEAAGVRPAAGTVQMRSHGWRGLFAPGDYFVIRRPGSDEWASPLTAAEKTTVSLMYDSAVANVDRSVGQILESLSALGLAGRTMVVVTSDHGEALGEDDRAGHAYLEDYNLMVPLIVELPGRRHAGTVIDRQVRLVDLMPTVLEVIGSTPAVAMDGQSLLPLVADSQAEFPAQAWSYAGSSNRGLALRLDNRLKYVFPDAAWVEAESREGLFDLRTDPTEHRNLAPDDPRLPALRETSHDTILDQHQGIRLRIVNRGDRRLEGRLVGAWANHDRVKTADHECDCIHWRPGEQASFGLAPDRETTLLFAQFRGTEVGIQGHLVGPGGEPTHHFETTFDVDTVAMPAALHLTASGWRMDESFTGEITTGFLVNRVGETASQAADPVTTDPDLLRQLQALGYVQ